MKFSGTLRVAVAVGLAGVSSIVVQAQTAAPSEFEVVSVKPRSSQVTRREPTFAPGSGRFTSTGIPLKFVIAFAYGVSYHAQHISGGPAWIGSNDITYDIEATVGKARFRPG